MLKAVFLFFYASFLFSFFAYWWMLVKAKQDPRVLEKMEKDDPELVHYVKFATVTSVVLWGICGIPVLGIPAVALEVGVVTPGVVMTLRK